LQAVAQDGLTYAKAPYDLERYDELRGVVAATMAEGSGTDPACVRGLPKLSRVTLVQIKRFFEHRRPEMPAESDRATHRGR
jgi:hypothetical protein